MNKQITLGEFEKLKENKKKYRIKTEYKADREEDQYIVDVERMMRESK